MGKMKNIAIDRANTERDLEKALGMSMEELEANVNGTVTTDFVSIHKALVDAVMVGMDISQMEIKEVPAFMNKKIADLLKRFPTLKEKLNNL
tara:strand:+ start:211 stop:486 length:276 start_codon:yes stop_codon:yes gene_type:complete